MPIQALSGVRVVDLTQLISGPFCTKLLADYGADVIKIEKPLGGDVARQVGPFFGDDPHPEKSGLFLHLNTNKRGITLNLETPEGRGIFRRLVEKSDIIVESFDRGYLDGLGLGYSALSSINPRLIMTSITPFGQEGPYKDYKGPDMVVFALSGLMSLCGDPDRQPVQISFPQSYLAASTYAAEGILIALYERACSGVGQEVDVSAQATLTFFTSEILPYWTFYHQNMTRAGGLFSMQKNIPKACMRQSVCTQFI